MPYKGHRPDLLIRVEKTIGELIAGEYAWDRKWHDAKKVSDLLSEDLHQTVECLHRLSVMGHLAIRREGGIVTYRVLVKTFLMEGQYPQCPPKRERKCHKCGKPIKRRHSRKGAHPDHECKLTVVKGIMEQ